MSGRATRGDELELSKGEARERTARRDTLLPALKVLMRRTESHSLIDGPGERPRFKGGDVVEESSLVSNMARRLRTPPLADRAWLDIVYIGSSDQTKDFLS